MKNIETSIEKNILTIKIDLTKTFGPSASGKTTIVASTEGNKLVDEKHGIYLGCNAYLKQPK